MVNGHTPVKTGKENPYSWRYFSHQEKTEQQDISLLNSSYGFQLVTHQIFPNAQKVVEDLWPRLFKESY